MEAQNQSQSPTFSSFDSVDYYTKFPRHSSGHKEVFNISCCWSLHQQTVAAADGKVRDQRSILCLQTVRAFQNESVHSPREGPTGDALNKPIS